MSDEVIGLVVIAIMVVPAIAVIWYALSIIYYIRKDSTS